MIVDRFVKLNRWLGAHLDLSVALTPAVEAQIGGVTFRVTEQVAQALAQERKSHAEALAAPFAASPSELAEAARREQLARERAEAAEARVKALEAELADERARRDDLLREAIKVGVAAAGADVDLISDACAWRGPVGHA